jgi:hypothetical protein
MWKLETKNHLQKNWTLKFSIATQMSYKPRLGEQNTTHTSQIKM